MWQPSFQNISTYACKQNKLSKQTFTKTLQTRPIKSQKQQNMVPNNERCFVNSHFDDKQVKIELLY